MFHSRLRFQLVFIASFLLFTANGFTSVAQDTRLLKDGSNTTFLPYSEEAIMPEGARVAIERHDEILRQQGYKVNTTRLKVSGIPTSPSSACGTCNDMGAENGWSYWKAFPGTFGPLINPVLTFNAIGVNPTPLRFNITSGSAIDRYTPGAPGTPSLPVVAPGFGQHSIQLGQPETDGIAGNCTAGNNGGNPGPGCAERLTFCFTVGPADTNFIYAYAFIIEDPGHGPGEEPFISFIILDATGDTVSCAYQRYEADQNDPRQYLAGRTRTNSQGTVTQATYKPWTIAGVNLTNYVGQTLTVVITNADCARSGHFAHSYWDFKCGNADAIVVPNCIYNSPDTLTGPPSTDPVSDPYSYTWFKNNTPNPVGYTQTIYPLSQNGDTFTVRVSNLAGCSWYARFVPQHDSVKADFIAQSNCGYANFVNQSFSPFVNDTIFSWTWTFNGGTPATATGQFPPDIYFPPGDHLVTLISSSRTPGCMDTIEHVVNVPHLPVADFTVPVQCAGTELTITNLSTCESDDTLATYSWNLPGAAPSLSSDTAPVITFDSGGVQTITLVATTTDGCRDTVSKTVQVLQRPTAGIAATPVCQGFPLQVGNTTALDGPYQPMQYAWSFPGGVPTFATDSAPVVSFTSSGSSDITLIATTPDGCSDTVQSQVAIHPTPQAEFVAPQVCESVEVSLDNLSSIDPASSIVGFHWYFTGGSIDTTSVFEPTLSFFPSGTDSILLVAIGADGCVDTVSGVIDVLPSPVTSFTLSDACFGEAVTVSDSSTIAAGGGTLSYSWSSSAGQFTSTSVPEPQLLFPAAGSYPVTLITTSTLGCSDTAQQTAIVHQLPLASFAAPPVCLGQATVFENLTSLDSLEQYSFLWSFPTGQPVVSSAFEPVVTFSDTGQSAVQLIVETGYGCLDTLDQFVTVYRPPLAVISSGDSACVPICHSFSDLSIQGDGFINQWTWSFPGGEPSSFTGVTPPQVCYAAPGSYEVELKVKSSIGCTSSVMVPDAIRAYSIPDAGFFVANPTSNVFSPSFQFQDTSSTDVVLWAWDFGDGTRLASSETSPVHSYAGSVLENDYYRFLVSLVVTTRYGCMDTVYGTVDVKPEFTFYVPSAFTPNGDGSNQFFFGKGIGIKRYTIRVFDRWGLQLWNCEEEGSNLTWDAIGSEGMPSSCQWDGTYAGMRVESDVYVWQVSLTDVSGVDHSYTGRVTVAY